jgi:ATP adenylyltransferase/5',5'''-P-1,P-4-tetraphosphate phosphorylase II
LESTHLFFNIAIGRGKPENIRNKEQSCPFCARNELTDIIAEEGSIILLKNKYPVLENAFQTVLIETDDCQADLSSYSRDHLVKLFEFGLNQWSSMEESGQFSSVLFFKNHGPLSGGTIAHSHMQIVGLYDINYQEKLKPESFNGITISENNGVSLILSTHPQIGFYEFYIRMSNKKELGTFSYYVQKVVQYLLNGFPFHCNSYNLFFYQYQDETIAKVIPRFITTPIYIGYSIPQLPNNLEWMAEDIKRRYFFEL